MRFLAKYLKEYKKESILAPLFKMLEAVFELLVPLVMAAVIDVGIAGSDTSYIMKMCGVLILLGVVGLFFSITAQYFAARAAIYSSAQMRKDLFGKIMDLSFAGHDAAGSSVLITRITSDVNQIQSGINMVLRLFLRSPFIVFGAMIMAFLVDVQAALVFLVVIPVLGLVVFLIMRSTLPMFRRIQKGLEEILAAVGENLEGVRVIRAFCRQDTEKERYDGLTEDLYQRQMKAGKISALMNPVTYVVVNLGVVAVLWFAARRVDAGILAQGEVVALTNYMSQILVELIKLANLIVLMMKAYPSIGRVQEIMELPEDERRKLFAEEAAEDVSRDAAGDALDSCHRVSREEGRTSSQIVFDDVTFCYPGTQEPAVEHISFTAKKGQMIGIIGGTGSGKSTLLHLLVHGYERTSGRILLDGRDIDSYSDEELSERMGTVPQKATLFSGTIRSNLMMGNENASDEELWQALRTAQAAEVVEKKDGALDAEVLQGGKNFSGGQKQRLTIARALTGRPSMVLLDDSASALDLSTEAALRKALRELPWQPTLFVVSQRASSVLEADQILVLDDGALVGAGTHEQLLADNETYQEIYYSQFPREEASHG